LVVIGLYYFMELQGGKGSGKVVWLPNKACQQWLVPDELVWEWDYSASLSDQHIMHGSKAGH